MATSWISNRLSYSVIRSESNFIQHDVVPVPKAFEAIKGCRVIFAVRSFPNRSS